MFLQGLSKSNFTYINGKQVGQDAVLLQDCDTICISDRYFRFEVSVSEQDEEATVMIKQAPKKSPKKSPLGAAKTTNQSPVLTIEAADKPSPKSSRRTSLEATDGEHSTLEPKPAVHVASPRKSPRKSPSPRGSGAR